MARSIRHPIIFVLWCIKALGGFPYRIPLLEEDNVLSLERSKEQRDRRHQYDSYQLQRDRFATVWSFLLLILIGIMCCLKVYIMDYYTKDIGNILDTLSYLSLVIAAPIMQSLFFYNNKSLASVVSMILTDIVSEKRLYRSQFLSMYIVLTTEFVYCVILTLHIVFVSSAYHSDYFRWPQVVTEVTIFLVFMPTGLLSTYGITFAVSKTLSLTLDKEIEPLYHYWVQFYENSNTNTLEDQLGKYPKFFLIRDLATEPNSKGKGYTNEAELRSNDSDWWGFSSLRRFLARADHVVEELMRYGSGMILCILTNFAVVSVADLYHAIFCNSLTYVVLATASMMKIAVVLSSPDCLIRNRVFWLRKFKRLRMQHQEVESSEVSRIISCLEDELNFSPFGLFKMGRHCFLPMVSAVLTYFIIAIQFRANPVAPTSLANVTMSTGT